MSNGVIGIEGVPRQVAGVEIAKDYVARFQLPTETTEEALRRAAVDCDLLASFLRNNPKEMTAMLEAVRKNNLDEARKIAEKLGFSEEAFQSKGGGLWHLIIIIVLVGGHVAKFW